MEHTDKWTYSQVHALVSIYATGVIQSNLNYFKENMTFSFTNTCCCIFSEV